MILVALVAGMLVSHPITLDKGPMSLDRAFELKRTMGADAFGGEIHAAVRRLEDRSETTGPCPTPAEAAAVAQLQLVRLTEGPGTFAKARDAALSALARRETLRSVYLGGAQAPFPYNLVGQMAARATSDPDPRAASLYRRMAEDQFSRIDSQTLKPFLGPGIHTSWEAGLDAGSLAYVDAIIENEWCAIDRANTAWLKADLEAHGWYRISTYGADADAAAWSLVQHARHDLAFQQEVLAMLEPLWRSGETKGANYAALYDQTANLTGRPDRFGIDGACTAPGVWTPAPQEDPAATDGWRSKAGLPPLSSYVAVQSRGCAD